MNLAAKSGACLAAAAAVLLMAGTHVVSAADSKSDVKCYGVNACKGKAACKTAANACKGQNACKGTGFVSTSATDCKTQGGSTSPKKS